MENEHLHKTRSVRFGGLSRVLDGIRRPRRGAPDLMEEVSRDEAGSGGPVRVGPTPLAHAVRSIYGGKVHVRANRSHLASSRRIALVAQVGGLCWVGAPWMDCPTNVAGLVYPAESRFYVDRGVVYLPVPVREWLAVADPDRFRALVVPAQEGGLYLVPLEGLDQRIGALA